MRRLRMALRRWSFGERKCRTRGCYHSAREDGRCNLCLFDHVLAEIGQLPAESLVWKELHRG